MIGPCVICINIILCYVILYYCMSCVVSYCIIYIFLLTRTSIKCLFHHSYISCFFLNFNIKLQEGLNFTLLIPGWHGGLMSSMLTYAL